MTSIHCHHPAVIFDKLSGMDEVCPDCGQTVVNQQCYPSVPSYVADRALDGSGVAE